MAGGVGSPSAVFLQAKAFEERRAQAALLNAVRAFSEPCESFSI